MTTQSHFKTAKFLAHALDDAIGVGPFKIGLDPIIGMIPGFGDIISLLLGSYILWIAHEVRIGERKLLKMFGNLAADFFIGLVPVAGDVADFFYKSNMKNLQILEEHLKDFREGEVVGVDTRS